jgi:hypothetical protein
MFSLPLLLAGDHCVVGRFWRPVVLFLLLSALTSQLSAAGIRLESSHVPAGVRQGKLVSLGRLPETNRLQLALALPLRDRAGLTNFLAAVYDPTRPEYHHYLTPAEFTVRFGPTPDDYAAIIHFAKTNGLTVTATHPNRLLVDVSGPVSAVERAFQVRLQAYHHPQEARTFFAPDTEPVVAAGLPLMDVRGLDNYDLPHPKWRSAAASPKAGSSPLGSYMGNDFRLAYLPGTPLTGAGQSVGLLQFDGFYAVDITNYASAIGLSNSLPPVTVVAVDGGVSTPGSGNIEVSLDIEMVLSMAPGVDAIYVYEAPNPSPWVDLLSRMANDNLAKQLSCSWGGGGEDPASEQIFLQMAAQGQSFFNASGDSDAFSGAVPFPSGSANITQVGGTTLTTDSGGNYNSEAVWNRGGGVGSSGGISTAVAIPAWQLGLDMTTNGGSTQWRNIPDVALTGENVYVQYNNGTTGNVGGTSCAAPLWAGVAALLNQQAAQLSQPPVGFLNPALYAVARGSLYTNVFHDVVAGNNTSSTSPTNYYAVPGYDLCTGLGTPNGTNFLNTFVVPDGLGVSPSTLLSSGQVGGPFSVASWTVVLTNRGSTPINWALGGGDSWLMASPVSGTLAVGGTNAVTVTLTGAEALLTGNHQAALLVTNLASDRVLPVAVSVLVGESVVVNGGFETGDFTGWTLVGDTVIGQLIYNTVASASQFSGVVHSGYYGAFLGQSVKEATLTQTVATTPGKYYLVSCWLNNPVTGSVQQFHAYWGGTNFASLVNPPAFGWTNLLFLTTAAATNTVVLFAAENDPNYFGLDDVTVTPLPPMTFAVSPVDASSLQLSWNSLAGLNYQVQYKTNLLQPDWLDLTTVGATTNVTTWTDTDLSADQRYYRLLLLPTP